jgi:hypothetical protein
VGSSADQLNWTCDFKLKTERTSTWNLDGDLRLAFVLHLALCWAFVAVVGVLGASLENPCRRTLV